ncbi:MAG: MFS transporter [bacterium]|nr:MFS transporter [bacterium]MDE0439151.1 MFS transporter [bacterium]
MNTLHRRYAERMSLPTRSASLVPALAAYGALTLTFDIVPILVPSTAEYYGVALSSGAWIYVMTDFGFGIAAFWYGIRSIRRRRLLLLGLGGLAIANLAAAGAPDFLTHLGARTLAGYAMGAMVAGAMGLVVDGANIPRRVGTLTAVMPAASVLMPVAGWVTAAHGWRTTLVSLAVIALAALFVAFPMPEQTSQEERIHPTRLFNRSATIGIASGVFWALGSMVPWVFVGALAEGPVGGDATLSGLALGVSGLAGFAAALAARRLTFHNRTVGLQWGLVACGLSVLWLVATRDVPGFLLAIAAWAFSHWFVFVVYQGLFSESVAVESQRGILTFAALPLQVGYGLGAVVASFVFQAWSFTGLGWVSAGLMVVSMGGAWWAWRDRSAVPTEIGST